MLGTVLSVISTLLLLVLIILLTRFKRSLPNIQDVLNDVGESIAEQLKTAFTDPMVKKSMTVLGKKSGEVRADNALRDKVAGKIMDQFPGLGLVLDQFDLTPVEGLKLINDPLIGPSIRGFLANAQGGLSKMFKPGSNSPSGSRPNFKL